MRDLEKQVAQVQKMDTVGQLAGGIAHDFNNVLSAIMMATDFLLQAHKPTDPSFGDIMQIKQNANRAASLVRHLLAFSRRQTLRPQVLDFGETLSDLDMLLQAPARRESRARAGARTRPLAGEGGRLAARAGGGEPRGECARRDAERRQAHRAHRERHRRGMQGRCPTSRCRAADYVMVEVTDTGTGIPKEIIEKIFEPFFTTKETGKGTGLGLSTVYGIVKQTNGYIFVDSTVGEGTTFRIFLPRHIPVAGEAAEPAQTDKATQTKAAADLTGSGTILLVEDEEGLRGLNARGLTSRGYTVLEAGNGVEAIEVIESRGGDVDLVVSDVVMPEMDGPTLAKELRARAIRT